MPTYEYRCPKGHQFEKIQKMTDKPRAKCPRCELAAERLISGGSGLIFKGSGFYITDYGKDGKGPRKSETETAKPEAKPDAKAEKPAAKAEGAESKPKKAPA